MFAVTYFPQLIIFGFLNGPLAWFNIGLLVLSESAAITGALTKTMLIERGLTETFDSVSHEWCTYQCS